MYLAMGTSEVQQLLCVLLCACIVSCKAEDDTIRPGASGSDVVHAVVGRIEDSNIFPWDNQFLRRIAYVESKDGTDGATYRDGYHGGIWQVDEVGFRATQDTTSHPGLTARFDEIQEKLGIDWRQVRWEDLRKPLYSGLAARLFLTNIPTPIPIASDVRAQGEYWKNNYNKGGAGTADKFVDDVEALVKSESKYNICAHENCNYVSCSHGQRIALPMRFRTSCPPSL